MSFYTYGHYTESGRLFYIGKGNGVRAYCKTKRNKYWRNTVNKHGLKISVFAHWETEQDAFEHERFLIACFRDDLGFKLVNQTDGGEGSSGWKMPLISKERISVASKRRWTDPNYVAKMAQRKIGSFTDKKLVSSLQNAVVARSVLSGVKKEEAAQKNSKKAKAMWAEPGFKAKMQEIHQKLWDEDRRAKQSLRAAGRVRITNGVVERNVLPADVDMFLQQGWTFGRGPNSPSKRTKSQQISIERS